MGKLASAFKNITPKAYWQVAAVVEKGRKVWVQDGKSANIFDLESATWSPVPDFPNVHKDVSNLHFNSFIFVFVFVSFSFSVSVCLSFGFGFDFGFSFGFGLGFGLGFVSVFFLFLKCIVT